jgi:NAD(P)-dependent dehydrogenase (short-subunit alcohol dehydrogenase family)
MGRMGVTVVTGSGSGIGAATRIRIESRGGTVIGIDLRGAEICADLSTHDGRRVAVREVLDRCDGRIDGLAACAGLGPAPSPGPLIVSVNYFGAIALLDGLKDALARGQDSAAVVVISNSATAVKDINKDLVSSCLDGDEGSARWCAEGLDGTTAYVASKRALGQAVRRRTQSFAEAGVRLNAVAPGATLTPLLEESLEDDVIGPMIRGLPIPLGGFGRPEQIAAAIDFLLGPDASFCAGSVLFVDGGSDALIRPDSF